MNIIEQRIDKLTKLLNEALEPTHLEIIDDRHKHRGHAAAEAGQSHFTVVISSPKFEGKTRIACHRMIYQACNDMINTEIHALQIHIQK